MVSNMMMEGTKNKTPVELEEAIDDLGASIYIYSGRESITLRVNCLASKFQDVYKLVEEILLEPRWDEKEFARIQQQTIEGINRNKANPNAISSEVFSKLVYGDQHIFGQPVTGTADSVRAITLEDLKDYYAKNFSPSVANIVVAGAVSRELALETFRALEEKWAAKEVAVPEYPLPAPKEGAGVFFVDMPGAKQSVIRIGNIGLAMVDQTGR